MPGQHIGGRAGVASGIGGGALREGHLHSAITRGGNSHSVAVIAVGPGQVRGRAVRDREVAQHQAGDGLGEARRHRERTVGRIARGRGKGNVRPHRILTHRVGGRRARVSGCIGERHRQGECAVGKAGDIDAGDGLVRRGDGSGVGDRPAAAGGDGVAVIGADLSRREGEARRGGVGCVDRGLVEAHRVTRRRGCIHGECVDRKRRRGVGGGVCDGDRAIRIRPVSQRSGVVRLRESDGGVTGADRSRVRRAARPADGERACFVAGERVGRCSGQRGDGRDLLQGGRRGVYQRITLIDRRFGYVGQRDPIYVPQTCNGRQI